MSCLAFVSIALPDSMLGVAWRSMRLSFGQPIGAAGLVPPFGVAAGLISTSLASSVVARVGIGRLLAGGTFLSAAALGLSAASTTFWQFLISVVLLGLSAGAVDASAVVPSLVGLAMGRSVAAFGPAIAALCVLTAALQVVIRPAGGEGTPKFRTVDRNQSGQPF